MDAPFPAWITEMAQERGWSLRELASHAECSVASLSAIMRGKTEPSAYICRRLAAAFDLPQTEVFRLAKLLDDEPDTNPLTDRLLAIAAQLSEDEMRDLLDYAELIKRRRKRKGTESG